MRPRLFSGFFKPLMLWIDVMDKHKQLEMVSWHYPAPHVGQLVSSRFPALVPMMQSSSWLLQLDIALTVGDDIQSPAVVSAKMLRLLLFYSCLKYIPYSTLFWVRSLDLLGSTKELKMVDWCHPVLGISLSNLTPSQVSNLSPYLLATCIMQDHSGH